MGRVGAIKWDVNGRKPVRRKKSKKRHIRPRAWALLAVLLVAVLGIYQLSKPSGDISSQAPEAYFLSMSEYAQYYGHRHHIFPSLILAQSALESDFGRSKLSKDYHNYFGIKQTGQEPAVSFETLESDGSKYYGINANFRAYASVRESVADYAHLIAGLPRYDGVVRAQTPEEAAYALVRGGYATDPAYAEKIIHIIHEYDLTRFDDQ